jgi:hypothetical protein
MQSDVNPAVAAGIGGMMLIFWLAIALIFIVGLWKVYVKAGQPGWAVLIPFYNIYILMKIVGKPGWWLILYCIPIINIVIAVIVALSMAKAFGRSQAFGIVMLFLLSGIGYLILGFGSDRYLGPPAAA